MSAPITFQVPRGASLGTCRSCGRRIVWIITAAGKRMPLDADPGKHRLSKVEKAGEAYQAPSHFATCPQAGGWRRR